MAYRKYKLGDLVEQYDEINQNGEFTEIDDLQGINSNKYFQECKSNKNDIDLFRYRICRHGMFSYNRATSRNGEKISIALRTGDDCIVSPSYYCFRVKDEEVLCPEYLDIWFKRPVFDRYARFNSWGSATEFFTFDDFCATEIMLPSLPEQRKIVHDYQVITDRIELLRKMNENLEAHMDTLFKEHVIDNPKYDFNEHIDDNIEYVNGLAMQDFRPQDGEIPLPVIKIRELTQGCCDENSEYCSPSIDPSRIINTGDLVFSWSGSLRLSFWSSSRAGLNQHLFKVTSSIYPDWFMYLWTKHYLEDFQRIAENKGTTFGHIKREDLHAKMVKTLDAEGMNILNKIFSPIQKSVMSYAREIQQLQALKTICLGSIGVAE